MPEFEISAVVAEERRGLLDMLRALDASASRKLGIPPDASENVLRRRAFGEAPAPVLERISPTLSAGATRICAPQFDELSRLSLNCAHSGRRSWPIS
jgi:hypothetical protein